MEYMILAVIIITLFFVFKQYIVRALGGYWKKASDVFGHGRQYDPKNTQRCHFDRVYDVGWYDAECWKVNCEDYCFGTLGTATFYGVDWCKLCKEGCVLGCDT